MATLRRSLIHVDFLMRKKKKKDKRRNTVADIESSALNGPIELIDNEKQRLSVPCTPTECNDSHDSRRIRSNHSEITVAETKVPPNIICISSEENNNTKSFAGNSGTLKNDAKNANSKTSLNTNYRIISKESFRKSNKCRQEENNELTKEPADWARRIKESVENKKKTRTNIPISTVSAAMTVAVKMRQTSGFKHSEDAQSSSGNWSGSNSSGRASSDSDDIKTLKDKASSSKDSLLSEPIPSSDLRSQNQDTNEPTKFAHTPTARKSPITKSPNSFNGKDKNYSFDSDDELSTINYMGYHTYASSTSISTGSNESLNSLLSRTATELSGSTETLMSDSKLPLPPPPPPPRISSAKPDYIAQINKAVDSYSKTYPLNNKPRKKENSNCKLIVPVKPIKNHETKKTVVEDVKSTKMSLSSLLQKKFKPKENQSVHTKPRSNTKMQKLPSVKCIDMYGGQSNNGQKVTILVNGNRVPSSPEKPKIHLQSFLPKTASRASNRQTDIDKIYSSENASIYSSSRASSRTECYSPTNSEVFSDSAVESSEELCVPLKYAPQITVVPLRRPLDSYQTPMPTSRMRSPDAMPYRQSFQQTATNDSNYKRFSQDGDLYQQNGGFYYSDTAPKIPGAYNTSKNACSAHVVLDSNGHVVHSTNSLDRRLYKKVPQRTYSEPPPMHNLQTAGYSHMDQRAYIRNLSYPPQAPFTNSPSFQGHIPYQKTDHTRAQYVPQNGNTFVTQNRSTAVQQNNMYYGSLPSRGKVDYRTHHDSNTYPMPNYPACNTKPQHTIEYSTPRVSQSLLTQENVHQHSREMDASQTSDCLRNRSALSENDYDHRTRPDLVKSSNEQKSITAEDLFAIIHDSKKRLNIKTDSDISPTPSSSRSCSPSFFRQQSKKGLAETGFLSPRGSCTLTPRDRRSWSDFRPAPERKSLASDRMGPSKPTSLHEFKMLLLQTRSTSGANQRKSAVEQLKATSPNKSVDITETMSNTSPVSSPSSPLYGSPTYSIYDGHLTVPLKRNHRARGLVQPRYIMYPPILEGSEEMENCSDTICTSTSKCPVPQIDTNQDGGWHLDNQTTFRKANGTQPRVRFGNSTMWV